MQHFLYICESRITYMYVCMYVSATGNRTPGICVTGRDVTNYTIADYLYIYAYIYKIYIFILWRVSNKSPSDFEYWYNSVHSSIIIIRVVCSLFRYLDTRVYENILCMYVYMIRVSKEYIACRCLKVAKIYVKKICEKKYMYIYIWYV